MVNHSHSGGPLAPPAMIGSNPPIPNGWGEVDDTPAPNKLLLDEVVSFRANPVVPITASASDISVSGAPPPPLTAFEPRRCRFGVIVPVRLLLLLLLLVTAVKAGLLILAVFVAVFGGAAAIGTTPDLTPLVIPPVVVPPAGEIPPPVEPFTDGDESESPTNVEFNCTEFLREAAFLDRVEAGPNGAEPAPPRFRFLIISVFNDNGRTTPCSFKNSPQALHSG